MTLVTNVSWLLSFLTLIGNILILIFLLVLIFSKNKFLKLKNFIGKNALFFAFIGGLNRSKINMFFAGLFLFGWDLRNEDNFSWIYEQAKYYEDLVIKIPYVKDGTPKISEILGVSKFAKFRNL